VVFSECGILGSKVTDVSQVHVSVMISLIADACYHTDACSQHLSRVTSLIADAYAFADACSQHASRVLIPDVCSIHVSIVNVCL